MDRSNYIHNYFTLLADKKTPAGTGLMKEEKYKNDKVTLSQKSTNYFSNKSKFLNIFIYMISLTRGFCFLIVIVKLSSMKVEECFYYSFADHKHLLDCHE